MSKLYMMRTLKGLEAGDESARTTLQRIKFGSLVQVEIHRPRNLWHHRKFFALLNMVWSTAGQWKSADELLIELKFNLGLTSEVMLHKTGEVVRIPGSISFSEMDQTEFEEFYERALRELADMAGGIEYDLLRNEVLAQLAAA